MTRPPGARAWLAAAVTAASCALGLVLAMSAPDGGGGVCALERPFATTVRAVEGALRLDAAVREYARPLEAAVFDILGAGAGDALGEAVGAYEEALRCDAPLLSPAERRSLEARVVVLLAEAGRVSEARDRAASAVRDPGDALLFGALAAALDLPGPDGGRPAAPEAGAGAAVEGLGAGWTVDRLAVRLARRAGDSAAASARLALLKDRALARLAKLRLWAFLVLALVAPGLAFGVAWLGGKRVRPRVQTGLLPAPWGGGEAWAVLAGGGALGVVGLLVVGVLSRDHGGAGGGLLPWVSLATLLPAVLLARARLFRRHVAPGHGILHGVGVDPPRWALPGLAVDTLVTVAVALVGGVLLRRGLVAAGATTAWADVVREPLLWGSPAEAALAALDVVAFAPVLEEILFRGVIYATIRRRLPALAAAPLVALGFGAVHLYSLGGFLEVSLAGLVYAVAYERTRSLAPAVAAHAVANGVSLIGVMLLLG